ncbi:MAG TPA: 3-dehydroquinate synthase family protein [Thermoanaerobaculia bacterium]|nr:3-dehydroquinate synthase family protein [Thermoanaerobaculia bacterium]
MAGAGLVLRHPRGSTPIWIGEGALEQAAEAVGAWLAERTVFLITSQPILALHGASLMRILKHAGRVEMLDVADGEAAKSLEQAGYLWQEMIRLGGKRDSRVLAFGGGSVGDLAGFAAGCFLRGIEVAQFPTTLLAQVDAALGGKTAIDLPAGKNMVGVFHHPRFVVAEARYLPTLPARELRSGLVEAIKMGFGLNRELFESLERKLEAVLAGDPKVLGPLAFEAARTKVRVVEEDPEEQDRRRLLNLGHTLGHALEAAAGYEGLAHGEAVAYGLLFMLRLAVPRGLELESALRLARLLSRLDLPALPAFELATVLSFLARDKKAREGGLPWVLATALGESRVVSGIGPEEVEREAASFLAAPWSLLGGGAG